MALEWRISVFTEYIKGIIEAAIADPVVPLDLEAVYYGDQNKVGTSNILCIEPNDRNRTLAGVPRKANVEVSLFLILYVAKVQSPQANRRESDELAEAIEDVVHKDPQLGGLCIHSMVSRTESGFVNKNNSLIRATRMTLDITTQQFLPYSQ